MSNPYRPGTAADAAWVATHTFPGADRERQALQWIGEQCESFTSGRCWDYGRTPDAPYTADKWCAGCIAAWGLGDGPETPRRNAEVTVR